MSKFFSELKGYLAKPFSKRLSVHLIFTCIILEIHQTIKTPDLTLPFFRKRLNRKLITCYFTCLKSYPLDFVFMFPFIVGVSKSRNRVIWQNKTPVECLQTSHLSVYPMGRFHSRAICQKCGFFISIGNDYSLREYS